MTSSMQIEKQFPFAATLLPGIVSTYLFLPRKNTTTVSEMDKVDLVEKVQLVDTLDLEPIL